jgi:TRAP-type mannitol/chloroaromatic compound transport system substrate-binding protein
MKRRDFVTRMGVGAMAGTGLLSACSKKEEKGGGAVSPAARTEYKWDMVTTWPKDFPGLGTGANTLARLINEMSGGRMQVTVYGAKEIVPAFEVFDAVSNGTAQMGHGAAYYWKGKNDAFQFFSTVPFGMNTQEMNGWLFHGGGLELWQEAYAPFNLIPAPAGNTTVQMAGWFNKEINSIDDLKGLKMRIPGLGGEVLSRAGGTPVNMPGGELFTALQTGVLDATEWVGPYNDLAFGFYKVAKYYYYPGWHEPGTTLEAIINKQAFAGLPADLQSIVLAACRIANQDMVDEYTANNNAALHELVSEHNVELRRLPDDVLARLKELSDDVVEEVASKSELGKKVFASYSKFRDQAHDWHNISERAYLNART